MKLDKHIPEKDKVEIVNQAEKKYELKKLGTITPQRGHVLFQINTQTGDIELAEYEKVDALLPTRINKADAGIVKKVLIKTGCVYVSALNKKNAIKKFNKRVKQLNGR